jgi:hypothetical protein
MIEKKLNPLTQKNESISHQKKQIDEAQKENTFQNQTI